MCVCECVCVCMYVALDACALLAAVRALYVSGSLCVNMSSVCAQIYVCVCVCEYV